MLVSPISIEALLVLDAIGHRGSYAGAAEQLNKVPSALSYIVQKLEEQLKVTIFQRQGRRSVLTPAGKHLLLEGRKVLQAMQTLAEQTQTIANGWEPKIRIAYDSILDNQLIFNCLKTFLDEHQNIEIDIQEEVLNGSWEALIEDRVDVVIGAPSPIPNQKGIRAIKITTINSILVANQFHDLSQSQLGVSSSSLQDNKLSAEDLAKYRTVVVHDSAKNEVPWSVNIIQGSRHFFVTSIDQKIAAIVAGIGIGYLPKNIIQHYLDNKQQIHLALKEELPSQDLYMAWKITNKGKGLHKLRQLLEASYAFSN